MKLHNSPEGYLFNLQVCSSGEAKRLWRKSIKEEWNNKCAYCGSDEELTIDHIVPQSKGGINFLTNLTGWAIWKQTSYNHNFRKQYAGIGMVYDPVKDKFLNAQPHASWSLDSNDDWKAPITYPTVTDDGADPSVWRYTISWNETKYNADNTQGWEAIKSNDTSETPTKYNWNGTAWVSE